MSVCFAVNCVDTWMCVSLLEAARFTVPMSWRDPSRAEPVWWRGKQVSRQPTAFPIDPTGNQAQNVCQVNQTERGKARLFPTHMNNTGLLSTLSGLRNKAPACLVWTPTDRLCDREKISTHRFCSAEMMELNIVQADWRLMHSSFVRGY